MRFVLAGMAAVVTVNAALADPPKVSCIDAKRSYVARPLNNHEIFVRNSFGTPKPPVRLTTSCYHLQSAIGFGLSAEFICIDQGDTVVANLMGERQTCVVTAIAPYVPQDGDLPEKK
jgi:hypothetical protein